MSGNHDTIRLRHSSFSFLRICLYQARKKPRYSHMENEMFSKTASDDREDPRQISDLEQVSALLPDLISPWSMISVDIIPFSEGLSLGRSWPLVDFDPDSHIILYLLVWVVVTSQGKEKKKKKPVEVRSSKQGRVCHPFWWKRRFGRMCLTLCWFR